MASSFVETRGRGFFLNGQGFRMAGANVYYLAFVNQTTVEAVLDLAVAMGLNVLRIWGFFEQTDSNVHFHFFNWARGAPDVHHGPDGLGRLDQAIFLAEQRGLRLILPLTNYWPDFGGMTTYCNWFGLSGRDQFYRDGRCRAAYWQWVEQLLLRENPLTHRTYAEEPAILAWELANEPRCENDDGSPIADGEDVLVSWIWEMATLIRSKDGNHLIAVGDEGFFHRPQMGGNNLFNGVHGASYERFLGVGPVDFGTFHMYASYAEEVGTADLRAFGSMWIREHVDAGARANKPAVLEEYGARIGQGGLRNSDDRAALYRDWLQEVDDSGAGGALVWMIGLPKSPDQPYDPDGYVIGEGPEAAAIRDFAQGAAT
jgi:mannan endo-1,4-beta-mannosidase